MRMRNNLFVMAKEQLDKINKRFRELLSFNFNHAKLDYQRGVYDGFLEVAQILGLEHRNVDGLATILPKEGVSWLFCTLQEYRTMLVSGDKEICESIRKIPSVTNERSAERNDLIMRRYDIQKRINDIDVFLDLYGLWNEV